MPQPLAWSHVTVFAGPSLSPHEAEATVPGVIVRPPAKRGNLWSAREAGARVIVLIDGVFAHHLAVSPREVVEVVRDGTCVIGASSMGALRAVDCRPVGVIGVGSIYRLFRRGILDNDDEVVVATNPDDAFSAVSVALINVRYAAARAVRAGIVDVETGRLLTAIAKELYFPERTWPAILSGAGIADHMGRILRHCRATDVKKDDARRALAYMKRLVAGSTIDAFAAPRQRSSRPPLRYPGHDRLFGESPDTVRRELCQWLFAVGRYRRYIWPLVAGAPEFQPAERNGAGRRVAQDQFNAALRRLLEDHERAAQEVWAELEFTGRLDFELAHWYAYRALAAAARRSGMRVTQRALLQTWRELVALHQVGPDVPPEQGIAAIPPAWIGAAAEHIALARAQSARGARLAPRSLRPSRRVEHQWLATSPDLLERSIR